MPETVDLFIIGGGINGCGIARDAAGRGLKVALAEMGDLAQGTSSASTKLIHGGLRYLEHYAFRLVREALQERETLLAIAPHIVSPRRFVLPQMPGMRPAWMLRLGLFLYDHLGHRKSLPPTRTLDLREDEAGRALKPGFTRGFEYSDCWVDDARLVVLNAMDAQARGADIRVRTRVEAARCEGDHWIVEMNGERGAQTIYARVLVNATGAWSGYGAARIEGLNHQSQVRLVKGSHIVVPKLFEHQRCYIFQNSDGRIVFAIPYENDFTLIGTTDQDFSGNPAEVQADEGEITYLLDAAGQYFSTQPSRADVVWSYAGVRALYDDGASAAKDATREYVLALEQSPLPVLTIIGGKITTYRRLAEAALDKLAPFLPAMSSRSWTGTHRCRAAIFLPAAHRNCALSLPHATPWLAVSILDRMIRSYGALTPDILADAADEAGLGEHIGAGLHAREVRWLMQHEWARTPDDILWRRSKLGLRVTPAGREALARLMAQG